MDTEIEEALRIYYQLKQDYETNDKENKKSFLPKRASIQEKKIALRQFSSKCVNCQQTGGTIFKTTYSPEDGRILLAYCGNKINPCPLNIKIYVGAINNRLEELHYYEKEIYELQLKLINQKNKSLFGLLTEQEAITQFKLLKEKLEDETLLYENYLNQYLDIFENREQKEKIKNLKTMIYMNINKIQEYIRSNSIQDSVQIYINELIPQTKALREMMYAINFVDTSQNPLNELIQERFKTSDYEINMGHALEVEKLQIHTLQQENKTKRIIKVKKNKTIKKLKE